MKQLTVKDVVHYFHSCNKRLLPFWLRVWPLYWRAFLKRLDVKESDLQLVSYDQAKNYFIKGICCETKILFNNKTLILYHGGGKVNFHIYGTNEFHTYPFSEFITK